MKILNHKFFLILTLAGSLSACIKPPEENLDLVVSSEQVQEALVEAWGEADPLTMEPNDFLFQETEQKIDSNSAPFFVLQEGVTISKKEDVGDDFNYTFLYQNRVLKQGEDGKESTREDHRRVSKPSNILAMQVANTTKELKTMSEDYQLTLGFERLYGLAFACLKTESMDKYCKETLGYDSCEIQCANLKTSTETLPLPSLIKSQPNCGGFSNCSYQVKKVAFDWTVSLKKGDSIEKQRVNYSVSMSPDMPFFSRLTEYCFRQLYPVQNQKVLVTTCTKLKNFKRGSSQLP